MEEVMESHIIRELRELRRYGERTERTYRNREPVLGTYPLVGETD